MKHLILLVVFSLGIISAQAKTLIVYYSYTNNVEHIVNDLKSQIAADVIEVYPAEKGLDYAANNYAIGSALISAIRNNPDNASSYPAIDQIDVDLTKYDCVIIGAPLWWSNMAAPLQTFLFQHGEEMAGKRIGLIVSSHSSGISGVEADARRLIPQGQFFTPSLWIKSAQTLNCHSMIADWLEKIHYSEITAGNEVISVESSEIIVKTQDDMVRVFGDFQSMAMFAMNGAKILETGQSAIPADALTPGMYLAVVTDANNVKTTHKLVIRRNFLQSR